MNNQVISTIDKNLISFSSLELSPQFLENDRFEFIELTAPKNFHFLLKGGCNISSSRFEILIRTEIDNLAQQYFREGTDDDRIYEVKTLQYRLELIANPEKNITDLKISSFIRAFSPPGREIQQTNDFTYNNMIGPIKFTKFHFTPDSSGEKITLVFEKALKTS